MPPLDDLGIANDLQARRASLVARLSPAARHQAFPKIYAKPMPSTDEIVALRQKVRTLTDENVSLRTRVGSLEEAVLRLTEAESAREKKAEELPVTPPSVSHSFGDVIGAFLEALASVSYTIQGGTVTLEHLRGPQRSHEFVRPKQVAAWLARKLCLRYSYPMLAREFRYRDHSTLCHSFSRAPDVMEREPRLKAAAQLVISRFEGEQP